MCVHARACMCTCRKCSGTLSEVTELSCSIPLLYSPETGARVEADKPRGLLVSLAPSQCWGYKHACDHTWLVFYVGPRACTASTLTYWALSLALYLTCTKLNFTEMIMSLTFLYTFLCSWGWRKIVFFKFTNNCLHYYGVQEKYKINLMIDLKSMY